MAEKKGVGVRVDPSTWSIKEWKQVAWIYATEDRLVCPTPGFLFSVLASGFVNDNGIVNVRDGHNVGGRIIFRVRTERNVSFYLHCDPPVYFTKGLFLDEITNMDGVTVQYIPWNP